MRWPIVAFLALQVPFTFFPEVYTLEISAVSLGFLVFLSQAPLLVVAQLYRYRRVSSPVQRQQTKWVVFGFAVPTTVYVLGIVPYLMFSALASPGSLYLLAFVVVQDFLQLLIPLSFGFAMLRSRLWDIDVLINRTLVYRAVIYGDTKYYDPDRSPIANLFDVSHVDPKEHFLLPLVIGLLVSANTPSVEEGFVETSKIYEHLQALGFTPEQIDAAIIQGHNKKLIETGARRIPQPGQTIPQTLRATTVGLYHTSRLCHQFAYIDAIIVDTPVFDPAVRSLIRDVSHIEQRVERAEIFRQYLDDQWSGLSNSGAAAAYDWSMASASLKEDIEYVKSRN